MDGGKVARYTEDNAPGDLPLISDLFAPKEYYDNDDNDPAGALPGWFFVHPGGKQDHFRHDPPCVRPTPQQQLGFCGQS